MELLALLYFGPGLFRTILIIAIIYFGIRLFRRYIFPMLLNKSMRNMQEKMRNQQHRSHPRQPEGKVTIEKNKQSVKDNTSGKGEYVDFEEVD